MSRTSYRGSEFHERGSEAHLEGVKQVRRGLAAGFTYKQIAAEAGLGVNVPSRMVRGLDARWTEETIRRLSAGVDRLIATLDAEPPAAEVTVPDFPTLARDIGPDPHIIQSLQAFMDRRRARKAQQAWVERRREHLRRLGLVA